MAARWHFENDLRQKIRSKEEYLEDYIGKSSPRIIFTARPPATQLHVCED